MYSVLGDSLVLRSSVVVYPSPVGVNLCGEICTGSTNDEDPEAG